jgi:hypothetical protein
MNKRHAIITDMEPKRSISRSPEHLPPVAPRSGEQLPGLPYAEKGLERRHEQLERQTETAPAEQAPRAPIALPPVVVPDPQVTAVPVLSSDAATDDTPVIAADEDLIEKEWVDKAKKIVTETKDDPYQREQQVTRLQVDYLRKRYGKELGVAE